MTWITSFPGVADLGTHFLSGYFPPVSFSPLPALSFLWSGALARLSSRSLASSYRRAIPLERSHSVKTRRISAYEKASARPPKAMDPVSNAAS